MVMRNCVMAGESSQGFFNRESTRIDANEDGFQDQTPDSFLKIRVNWRAFAVNVTPSDRGCSLA
jgi:hypothetical protein